MRSFIHCAQATAAPTASRKDQLCGEGEPHTVLREASISFLVTNRSNELRPQHDLLLVAARKHPRQIDAVSENFIVVRQLVVVKDLNLELKEATRDAADRYLDLCAWERDLGGALDL